MFQTMADFTPLAISLVGLGQVGIVGWGIHVMRNASAEAKRADRPHSGIASGNPPESS